MRRRCAAHAGAPRRARRGGAVVPPADDPIAVAGRPPRRACRRSPPRCARAARAWGWASCSPRSGRWPRSTRPRAPRPSTRCARRCAPRGRSWRSSPTRSWSCSAPRSRGARSTTWARSPSRRCRGWPCPQQGDEAPVADLTPTPAAWSEEELLREKDFAAYTDAERAAARRLLARIAQKGPKRLSRRTIPTTAPARRARPAGDDPRLAAHRRRAARAALPRAGDAPAAARADLRRERLDGAVQPDAAAVHAGVGRRPRAGRGVRVRHAADARHPRAARPRLRPRARRAPPPRSTTGAAAPGSARRSPSSTASTAAGSAAARW